MTFATIYALHGQVLLDSSVRTDSAHTYLGLTDEPLPQLPNSLVQQTIIIEAITLFTALYIYGGIIESGQ